MAVSLIIVQARIWECIIIIINNNKLQISVIQGQGEDLQIEFQGNPKKGPGN